MASLSLLVLFVDDADGSAQIDLMTGLTWRRPSLRWRLPLLVCGLIALVVTTFLWAAYRQVEGTLLRAGDRRALAAAEHVAALLSQSAQQRLDEVGRAAEDALVQKCLAALSDTGLDSSCLHLEITERAFIGDVRAAHTTLNRLQSLGIEWSIDDLGTGYSSLSYLHRLQAGTVKIDRSFVSRPGHAERPTPVHSHRVN